MVEQRFKVIDINTDELLFTGTNREIQKKYGIPKGTHVGLYALKGHVLYNKYRFALVGEDNHLVWQTRHLERDKNTPCHGNPDENIAELKELGYICEKKEYVYKEGRRKKKRYSLYLKEIVKNAPTKETDIQKRVHN